MGRKGVGYYTFRSRPIVDSWTGFSQQPVFADVSGAVKHLVDAFLAGSGETVAHDGETSRASTNCTWSTRASSRC